MTVTLITVTYGKRFELLRQCLESGFRDGCDRAVVVDNGSQQPIAECVANIFGDRVRVVSLPRNSGSANGFATGIESALNDGTQHILLLDDDNILQSGALTTLRAAHQRAQQETSLDSLIVVGLREEHQFDVARGEFASGTSLRSNTFLCFHFADAPGKVWKRTMIRRSRKRAQVNSLPERIERAVAPYGGMYFHRSLIERHGLPDARFVLYADDYEFSYRITRTGGKIWLITTARVDDLENSWNLRSRYKTGLEALLCGASDLRAYYNCRNFTYFENRDITTSATIRQVNRSICLAALWFLAIRHRAGDRRRLLMRSIADGERGRLGINPDFPLP